jgi:hypothetical protein
MAMRRISWIDQRISCGVVVRWLLPGSAVATAAAQRLAGRARLSVRVLDRSLDQYSGRRRAVAGDEGRELFAIFVGIETPDPETLVQVKKKPNTRRNIAQCIHKIYGYGMFITAGASSSGSIPQSGSIPELASKRDSVVLKRIAARSIHDGPSEE